ncbi:hypothetical protein NDA16_000080 [Ustilago loliicola]|nr:hypothetical protein NDA16_000080 [Ustilago loliicola]
MLYTENEKVLCFHGPLIYSAKILKAEKWTGDDNRLGAVGPHYFVHYDGWKKTWDEWVPETRLLKHNEENLARKATLEDAAKSGSLTSSSSTKEASSSSGAKRGRESDAHERKTASGARGTKRSRDTVETEEESLKRPEVKISLPDQLKLQLVDDWENITKSGLLVPLPRKPCVKDILEDYRKHYLSLKIPSTSKTRSPAVVEEVLKGLKLYFDRSLGQNLLYRFERAQYVEYRKKNGPKMGDGDIGANTRTGTGSMGGDMEPSDVYGAEHLLRLFVNLPMIIPDLNLAQRVKLEPELVLVHLLPGDDCF